MIGVRRGTSKDARWSSPANALRASLASIVVCAAACSSPMDVIATYGPATSEETAVQAARSDVDELDGATSSTRSGRLILAGQPLPNWRGATYNWPLEQRLSKLFAEEDAAPAQRPKKGHSSSSERTDDRPIVVTVEGRDAARLFELLQRAWPGPGDDPALIVRDEFDDRYLIVFEFVCGMGSAAQSETGCVPAEELESLD